MEALLRLFLLMLFFFLLARVTIFLNTLEPGKVLDQWFTLGSLQHKSEMGSIRLTAKFIVSSYSVPAQKTRLR